MELNLLGKQILVDESPAVDTLCLDNWQELLDPLGGQWGVENGALIGRELGNKGGIALTRKSYPFDAMIRCKISTLLPSTRDVNVVYNAQWDEKTDYLKIGYIAGLNGWYDEKAGIERFPENGLNVTTPLFRYEPGTEIDLIAGAVAGHNFLAVNGQLILEMIDPDPIPCGRLGFSPYCTQLAITQCAVHRIVYRKREQFYTPEF